VPLYLAGSRLREVYPHLPLFEQQGIGIALLSYAGRLHVGITADWSLGDLVGHLVERMATAFDELAVAAGLVSAAAASDEDVQRPNGSAGAKPSLQVRAVPV
jgi:hypothetical protein